MMDFGNEDNMDESGISLGFDLTDADLDQQFVDISDLFPDELLQAAASPPTMESHSFYEITSRPAPVQNPSFKSESVSSRTQLKQQLMKDQLLKEKERQRRDPPQTPKPQPVQVPANIQNVVPHHVLHVTTGLQNPTKYHIMEKQKHQVIQFLSSSQKEAANFGDRPFNSAPIVRQRPPAASGKPSASFTVPPPSPGMQSVTSGGTSDAEEVIDSILSYEENSDARPSLYGSNASLESSSQRFKSESNSYEDAGRVKKETHNLIERRRRYNINDRIKELGDLLPQRNELHYDIVRDSRANKGTILKSSVDYIKMLKEDTHKMKQMELDNRSLQLENRKLLLRIQQLENKAQEKGIPLEEKTWRPAPAEHIIAKYVRTSMPDIVTDAARAYDETMDDVKLPDPMLTSAATLPPLPRRTHPLSPSVHMDTE